jgi:hypothetical protein
LRRWFHAFGIVALGSTCTAGLAAQGRPRATPYAVAPSSSSGDTLRVKSSESAAPSGRGAPHSSIHGYLSSWGLPPVPGEFILSDSGVVFQASASPVSAHPALLSLAYVEEENGRAHYVFRIDSGVFETETPGPLLQWATHPDSVKSGGKTFHVEEGAGDAVAALRTAREAERSAYADSLYRLFGRPSAPVGLVGKRGRAAGRLGEYIASRDSLALDPARMTSEAQLRHALAHELGHRWQVRARAQLAALWTGVPEIRDPKRYGYRDPAEHQAEAIAFAINFLQATAGVALPADGLKLLEHYELLVPGTRALARYLLLQPVYQKHPLRPLLTGGQVTYAREK